MGIVIRSPKYDNPYQSRCTLPSAGSILSESVVSASPHQSKKLTHKKSPSSSRVIFLWIFVSEASSYINYAREAAIKGRQIRNFFWKQTFWENLLMNVYTVQLYSRKRRSIVTFSLLLIMCEFCNKKYIKRHKYRKNRMEWQMTKHTNANPVFALGSHAWSGEGKYVDHRPERPFCIVFFHTQAAIDKSMGMPKK